MSVVQPVKGKADELILRFLEHCHRRQFPAKSTIIRQGDPSHDLFYIVRGSVTVMLEDEEGRELVLAYLNAGDFFGEIGLFNEHVNRSALVRAKIMAIRGSSVAPTTAGANATLRARRDTYVALAARALRAPESLPRPRLLLLHGLSGSGKTWLARRLAPRLEAIHLRSDVERKRLAGLAPLASSASAPGAGLYSSAASERTYEHLAKQARTILRSGRSVVCDAAFLSRASRAALRAAAAGGIADLVVVHCTAPDAELRRRLRARQTAGNDASEADAAVLDWQLRHVEPLQPTECDVVVEVDTTAADPLGATLRALGDAAA